MCFLWLVNTLCLFSLQAGDSTDDPHHQTLLEVVFCVAVRTEHGSLNVVMLDVELMCFSTLPPLGCCDQRVSRTCWVCPSPRFSVSVSLCFSLSLSVSLFLCLRLNLSVCLSPSELSVSESFAMSLLPLSFDMYFWNVVFPRQMKENFFVKDKRKKKERKLND